MVKVKTNQRAIFSCVLLCALALGFFGSAVEAVAADPKPVKIAVVYPMSGALARNGNLCVQGAKAAIKWVNDQGGIKSLGGAKLEAVVADTGSSVEGAASAMERVLRDSSIPMAMGCWASSFTMSATEITERLGVPQFSISYADELTKRGFKYRLLCRSTEPGPGPTWFGQRHRSGPRQRSENSNSHARGGQPRRPAPVSMRPAVNSSLSWALRLSAKKSGPWAP